MSERCRCDSSSAAAAAAAAADADAAEDSSDLEESWAGEDVNFDGSPEENGQQKKEKSEG